MVKNVYLCKIYIFVNDGNCKNMKYEQSIWTNFNPIDIHFVHLYIYHFCRTLPQLEFWTKFCPIGYIHFDFDLSYTFISLPEQIGEKLYNFKITAKYFFNFI